MPTLKYYIKQLLLSASAKALKISQVSPNPMESYVDIHLLCKRALPIQILLCKYALLLHKLYNKQIPQMDWIEVNFTQTLTSRETVFDSIKYNCTKIGNNILTTRLTVLNKKIKLEDLNLNLNSFKVNTNKFLSLLRP